MRSLPNPCIICGSPFLCPKLRQTLTLFPRCARSQACSQSPASSPSSAVFWMPIPTWRAATSSPTRKPAMLFSLGFARPRAIGPRHGRRSHLSWRMCAAWLSRVSSGCALKANLPRYPDLSGPRTARSGSASLLRQTRPGFLRRIPDCLFCSAAEHQFFQHRSVAVQQRHDHQQSPQRCIRLGATRTLRDRPQTPRRSRRWLRDFAVLCCRRATRRRLHAPLGGPPHPSRCRVGGCRHAANPAGARAQTPLKPD